MRLCEWLERKGNHRCSDKATMTREKWRSKQASENGAEEGSKGGGVKEGCVRWLLEGVYEIV